MRGLKFITGHVIYNLACTYKFQLKTTNRRDLIFASEADIEPRHQYAPNCKKDNHNKYLTFNALSE